MKKMAVVLLLGMLMPAVSMGEVVWENNCSSLTGWNYDSGNGAGVSILNGTMIQMNSWAQVGGQNAGWTSLWRSTGIVMSAGTTYTLTITMDSFVSGGGNNVPFSLQNVTEGWRDLASASPFVASGGLAEYSVSYVAVASDQGDVLGVSVDAGWWNNLGIDHVQVSAVTPVYRAFDPTPLNGQTNYGTFYDASTVQAVLSWSTALDPNTMAPNSAITHHYLYIQAGDPNITKTTPDYTIDAGDPVQATASITVYLEYDQTYYWRIDEAVNGSAPTAPATIAGNVWSFSTLLTKPAVLVEPLDVLAAPSETVVLTFTALQTPSPLQYMWYRMGGETPNPASDTLVQFGFFPELTLANVQISDGGTYYYCVVTNVAGSATTRPALLEVERLAGHWPLDGDLSDVAGRGWTATATTPALLTFGDGIDGQALALVDDPNLVIYVGGSNRAFNFHHLGLTVSAWIKTDVMNWSGVVSKQYREETPWTGWLLGTNNQGYPYFAIRNVSDTGYYPVNVADGEWHLLTATYDAAEGVAYLFVDGEPAIQDATPYAGAPLFALPNKPVVIGAEQDDGFTPYSGLIDDVRIYTYPKNALDIARLYVAFETDAKICMESPVGDLSGDCKVDIEDFAILALHWLDCNIVPDCIQ